MASRRDQYQGYRFVMRRHTGALLREDSDIADAPLRRLSNGTWGGVLAGLLGASAAALFGLLSPADSHGWQNGKSLIVARDSGARYVYVDGVLHPVLNYASALLILKAGAVAPVSVSRGALNSVTQGPPIGIAGAPDSVPAASSVVGGPWTVCDDQAVDSLAQPVPQVTLYVGAAAGASAGASGGASASASAGVSVGPTTPLPQESAILVQDPAGTRYLVWNGERLRLTDSQEALALGYTSAALPVAAAWVNAVPAGPDLAAPEPAAGLGGPGPAVDGKPSRIGQLFSVNGATYVMEGDGLAPITPFQVRLFQADPAEQAKVYGGGEAVATPAGVAALNHLSATQPANISGLPHTPPTLVDVSTGSVSVCATLAAGSQNSVTVATRTVAPATDVAAAAPTDHGTPVANRVTVPAGHAALVRLASSAGDAIGTEYLLTDRGVKYPISGSTVLSDLGLAAVAPTPLPPGFVALAPTGPALGEAAAAVVQPNDPNG